MIEKVVLSSLALPVPAAGIPYGYDVLREAKALVQLMGDPDPEKTKRVTDARLKSQRIIVADLLKA